MKTQSFKSEISLFILYFFLSNSFLSNAQSKNAFSIVSAKTNATICIDKNEVSLVHKAAGILQKLPDNN